MIEIRLDESEGGDTSTFDTPEIFISKDAIGNALDVTEALTHSADLLSFEEVFQLGLPGWILRFTGPVGGLLAGQRSEGRARASQPGIACGRCARYRFGPRPRG